MALHESGINYRNLIRDLADMYPQSVSEVILIELIANCLDANATKIKIDFDPKGKRLVVQDNGRGMNFSDFDQYHDFAAGLKTRGTGIGFAGVGAKISFNIADTVVTETREKSFTGGSNWHFKSKGKLVWEDIKPTHLRSYGTRVEVRFCRDAKLSYASADDLIALIKRHYLPLLDQNFLNLYEKMGYYSKTLRFVVNGEKVNPFDVIQTFNLENTKVFFPKNRKKKIGYGIFGLATSEYPVGPDVSGILLCTRGKVIKPELFNQFPSGFGPNIFGLVEIPDFVKYLTTSKTDFIRRGTHKKLESLYAPVRQEFKDWLFVLGVQQIEPDVTDDAARLEKELKKMLDDIPELNEFFGFRAPKNILSASDLGLINTTTHSGSQTTFPSGTGIKGNGLGVVDAGEENGVALIKDEKEGTVRAKPISRTTKRGPKISFAKAPNRVELAWVEGNTITINSGHPCYKKAQSRTLGKRLHNFYAIATTVQRFLGKTNDDPELMFIDRMMAVWGQK